MFKKLCLSTLLLISLPAFGMEIPMEMPNISASLTSQLKHVNDQINAAKKAYEKEGRRMAKLKDISLKQTRPAPYAKSKATFEKIIKSDAFIANMNAQVNQQFESIVNNYAFFKDVKVENNIANFTSKPMDAYTQQLFSAMANRAYYALLGKKLSQKSKELAATIRAAQQAIPIPAMPALQQTPPEWIF